jgi:patatin-like phospholipase/acyl hydrolase
MKISLIIIVAICVVGNALALPRYNILSFDGGAIRGILTASCVERMESFSYEYAVSKGYKFTKFYLDGVERKRIPMSMLFDMMTGTSIGSILTVALSLKKYPDDNTSIEQKFWAKDAIKIYSIGAKDIMRVNSINAFSVILFLLIGGTVAGLICYFCSSLKYDNKKKWQKFNDEEKYLM